MHKHILEGSIPFEKLKKIQTKTNNKKSTLTLQPKIRIRKEKCPKQKRPQKDKKDKTETPQKDKTGQRKREKWVRPQNPLKRPKCTFPSKNRDNYKDVKQL